MNDCNYQAYFFHTFYTSQNHIEYFIPTAYNTSSSYYRGKTCVLSQNICFVKNLCLVRNVCFVTILRPLLSKSYILYFKTGFQHQTPSLSKNNYKNLLVCYFSQYNTGKFKITVIYMVQRFLFTSVGRCWFRISDVICDVIIGDHIVEKVVVSGPVGISWLQFHQLLLKSNEWLSWQRHVRR